MRPLRIIHTLSCHAEGEVDDVMIDGVEPLPGRTVAEMRDFIEADGRLRSFMLNEPRGGVFRHVNLLVPPHPSQCRCRLHHHGAGIYPADVGL